MKSLNLCYLIACLLWGAILVSCSPDSSKILDEPEPNKPNNNPTERVANWTVVYNEISSQDPGWEQLINTSESCIGWKHENEPYFFGSFKDGNSDISRWLRKYNSTKESIVIKDIETFIKFSLKPAPNSTKLSGYDAFDATLTNDDWDYTIEYTYYQYNETTPINKWVVKFDEVKSPDIVDPSGYTEWFNSHKEFLTYESEGRREWVMEETSISVEFIEKNILPFIHFSQIPKPSSYSPFSRYTVSVSQVGSGISQNYEYTSYQ